MRCTPSICNSRERHNALNFCCLAKYHSLQIDGGFLNGTESRVLLPLWKWETEERCRTGAVERVHGESGLRNGTELRVLLPLWKGGTEGRCRTGPVERVHGESDIRNGTESWVLLPLWKREAEGRCRTGVCGEGTWGKRLPQRHRNVDFAAVVEKRVDNVAGKRRTNDFCYFWGVN